MPLPVNERIHAKLFEALQGMTFTAGYSRDWTAYAPTFEGESQSASETIAEDGMVKLIWWGPWADDEPTSRAPPMRDDFKEAWVAVGYVDGSADRAVQIDKLLMRARADLVKALCLAELDGLCTQPRTFAFPLPGTVEEHPHLETVGVIIVCRYQTKRNRHDLLPNESA